jgi:hypothetical protein
LPGLDTGSAGVAASAAVGCEREKKLGSDDAGRTGGTMIGASDGAVGAVATDRGNALNGVGLGPERSDAVTGGGVGRAGAVVAAASAVMGGGGGRVGAFGPWIVTGGGAVGRTTGGRCGSRADDGELALTADRRGAAEATSPGSMLAE